MGMTSEEFLAHHGIKGMKWGVRRAERARANSNRMQEIVKQRPTAFNQVAAQRIDRKATRLEIQQRRKLNMYGDKSKGKLTLAQKRNRRARNVRRANAGVRVAAGAVFVAAMLKMKGTEPPSSWRLKPDAPKVAKTVADIINQERDHQVSSLIRTHKEGHIDKAQLDNFLSILNKRYDRKIFEAGG